MPAAAHGRLTVTSPTPSQNAMCAAQNATCLPRLCMLSVPASIEKVKASELPCNRVEKVEEGE